MEDNEKKPGRNLRDGRTKKITYTAVLSAMAGIMIIITNFTFLTFVLLMAAALCYFIIFDKCGTVFGFIGIAVSILISFFTSPLSGAFFLTIMGAAPYSFLAYLLKKFRYTHFKEASIRVLASIVFACLLFTAIYFLSESVLDLNIQNVIGKTGWAGFGVIFVFLFIGFDFAFNQLTIRLNKILR